MFGFGRNRSEPAPWIEQLVLSNGTSIPWDRAVTATVIAARDLTESQDETDASCIAYLSDGVMFIPAVLTTQAWARLQDMEERESFSGLENAIVSVKNMHLKFHMEPELIFCKFYVTVHQMSTMAHGSFHRAAPSCLSFPTIQEQVRKSWRSQLDDSVSQSDSGFRLTELLEQWEQNGGTQVSPQDLIDKPNFTSEPIMANVSEAKCPVNSTSHLSVNEAVVGSLPKALTKPSIKPSTSQMSLVPPTTDLRAHSLDHRNESEEISLLRRLGDRLKLPGVLLCPDEVTMPTQWHRDRLSHKGEDCFSVPLHNLIPQDERGRLQSLTTTETKAGPFSNRAVSTSSVPPLCDKHTQHPITSESETPDQLPSSGERIDDDSPSLSVAFIEPESVREGGAWDIFSPVLDAVKSPSSSEISATPEDLPLQQSQSAPITTENLLLLQSQSDTAPDKRQHSVIITQSDSATPDNLPCSINQSNPDTPENPPVIQGPLVSTVPEKQQSMAALSSPVNLIVNQSHSHCVGFAPIGASTQCTSSNGSGTDNSGSTLPPYQVPPLSGISPSSPVDPLPSSQVSSKENENEVTKAQRSPPSWIMSWTQWAKNHPSQGAVEPKRMKFGPPPPQSLVHPDGTPFSYKYQPSMQVASALAKFVVPPEMIRWSIHYLLPSSQPFDKEGRV